MYNRLLKTLVGTADAGSFTKASEKLFMSPTAVMKQINQLEDHLNLKLLTRSASGVKLTPGGEIIYRDAKIMFEMSEKALTEAKKYTEEYETTFCIGTSILNPAKAFMDLWNEIGKKFPNYKLHLVPFDDDHENILSEISQFNIRFDFLVGVCDSKLWLTRCNFLPLGKYKPMIAVSQNHRLAKKKKLQISDLYGETLIMVAQGDSEMNDTLRADLKKNHPQIKIEDSAFFYDISVFNRCAESGNAMLSLECWKNVRPDLVTIPIDWDYSISYGIMYALEPPADVSKFIKFTKAKLNKQK